MLQTKPKYIMGFVWGSIILQISCTFYAKSDPITNRMTAEATHKLIANMFCASLYHTMCVWPLCKVFKQSEYFSSPVLKPLE